MALRQYVERNPATVQDLELASASKLMEGVQLLTGGSLTGGVYLLGYVAEMVLKNACFLFDGARPADAVYSRLAPCRTLGKSRFPQISSGNYHSLVFWYHVLVHKRQLAGSPLPVLIGRQLGRRVARVHNMWVVALRYYPDGPIAAADSEAVYDDVLWMYDHRLQLRI